MSLKVCITGVSSGLGHGLAKVYLERGALVYGCSRREPPELIAQGLRYASVDLANTKAGVDAFAQLIQPASYFDIVILNAAKLGKIRDMADTPPRRSKGDYGGQRLGEQVAARQVIFRIAANRASCGDLFWCVAIREPWLEWLQYLESSAQHANQALRRRAASNTLYSARTRAGRHRDAGLSDESS